MGCPDSKGGNKIVLKSIARLVGPSPMSLDSTRRIEDNGDANVELSPPTPPEPTTPFPPLPEHGSFIIPQT